MFCQAHGWRLCAASIACLIVTACSSSLAQESKRSRYAVGVVRTADGRVFIGADPNDAYQILCQLVDRQVQEYVGLTPTQIEAHSKIISDFQIQYRKLVVAERAGEVPRGAAADFVKVFTTQASELLEELLLPEQNQRVRNAIFRLEAKRIGLGEALVYGRLSDAVGIYENQKDRLTRRAEQIERRVQEQIAAIELAAERELLNELAPEQRVLAESSLGEQFEHKDIPSIVQTYRSLRAKQEEYLSSVE